MKTPPNFRNGFSLTEIMIALAIFSMAAVSLLGVLPVGLTGIRNAARSSEAVNLAQVVFADLELSNETGTWPSEAYNLELPTQGAGASEELFLSVDGRLVKDAGEAAYRCSLLMVPRERDPSAVHVHAKVTWPAPAAIENAQGAVELVTLIESAK